MNKLRLGTALFSTLLALALPAGLLLTCTEVSAAGRTHAQSLSDTQEIFGDASKGRGRGKVVVADRASGTISVISTKTDELIGTYLLPERSM